MFGYHGWMMRNWRETGYTGHVVHPANQTPAAAEPAHSRIREHLRAVGNLTVEALGHLGVAFGVAIPVPAVEGAAPAPQPPQSWDEIVTAQDFLSAVDAARKTGPNS